MRIGDICCIMAQSTPGTTADPWRHVQTVAEPGVLAMSQEDINKRNAQFWNELCGSSLARAVGLTDHAPESLRRFDAAFLALYPYLGRYIETAPGKKVLEIGLGYGTLGQLLASRGFDYYGLDIAEGSVAMMRYRLDVLGQNGRQKVQVGSALDIPHPNESFDYVYTIGCLHHTGNLPRAIAEVHRILAPHGKAVVMLYHRHSFRQLFQVPWRQIRSGFARDERSLAERVRAMYDINSQGEAAPHTDYVSWVQARRLFRRFSHVRIHVQNFDSYALFKGWCFIPREKLLNNVARVCGLDLYIQATK